jgi:hypothetical protein
MYLTKISNNLVFLHILSHCFTDFIKNQFKNIPIFFVWLQISVY